MAAVSAADITTDGYPWHRLGATDNTKLLLLLLLPGRLRSDTQSLTVAYPCAFKERGTSQWCTRCNNAAIAEATCPGFCSLQLPFRDVKCCKDLVGLSGLLLLESCCLNHSVSLSPISDK